MQDAGRMAEQGLGEGQAVCLSPEPERGPEALDAAAGIRATVDLHGVVCARGLDVDPSRVAVAGALTSEIRTALGDVDIAEAPSVDEELRAVVVPHEGSVVGVLVSVGVEGEDLGEIRAVGVVPGA